MSEKKYASLANIWLPKNRHIHSDEQLVNVLQLLLCIETLSFFNIGLVLLLVPDAFLCEFLFLEGIQNFVVGL